MATGRSDSLHGVSTGLLLAAGQMRTSPVSPEAALCADTTARLRRNPARSTADQETTIGKNN